MTDLSPAAQAVLDAYRSTHLSINNLAAALRAVADQLLPVCSTQTDSGMQRMLIRNDLLVIAEELEAQ